MPWQENKSGRFKSESKRRFFFAKSVSLGDNLAAEFVHYISVSRPFYQFYSCEY